jgi:hypothetical protein
MSDLKFLQYAQLIIFTAFLITCVILVITIIKEKYNEDK